MNIVVIDTATEACSVAVQYQDKVIGQFSVCPQQQSVTILPMLAQVLDEAGLAKQDIQGIGFGHGPGSFTGVRIALGMTQGLALGLDVPVVGMSTLATLAQEAFSAEQQLTDVYAAIDARMDEVYFAHYQLQQGLAVLVGTECVISPKQALSTLPINIQSQISDSQVALVGTGWEAYSELSQLVSTAIKITLPNALYMLPLVAQQFALGKGLAIEDVEPVYLRDTVTWKKLPGKE
jgi:tRNA threonylcarbamoyladenosine biosynthesis protein TsaB